MRVGLVEGVWAVEGWLVRAIGRAVLVLTSIVITMLAGGSVWWVCTAVATHRNEAAMKRRWLAMGRPFEEVVQRFPDRAASASAIRLEELAAALGIDMVPHNAQGRTVPDPTAAEAFKAVKAEVKAHAELVSRTQQRSIPLPPLHVRAFLQSYDAEIEAVVEHLLGSEIPRWRQQPAEGLDAPLPHLLGQFQLTRLLVVRAADMLGHNQLEPAADTAEAAWRLQLAAADRPELISQLVGIAEAQAVAGIARCHLDPPANWPAMLLQHDYRSSVLDAFHYDAWGIWYGYRHGQVFNEGGSSSWLLRVASTRFLVGQAVYSAEAIRTAIDRLPSTPFVNYDSGEAYAEAVETMVGDRRTARMTLVDVWDSWNRIGYGMLGLELSAHTVEMRRRGNGPDPIPWSELAGDRPSRLMPSVTWCLSPEAGGLRIAPAQQLPPTGSRTDASLCRSFLLEPTQ